MTDTERTTAAGRLYDAAYRQGAEAALRQGYAIVCGTNDQGETFRVKIEKEGPFLRTTEAK